MKKTKPQIYLFADGSVNPQSGIGYGGYELYKEFFKVTTIVDCEFIKVKGHKKTSTKNEIDNIFTLVDRATRNALRQSIL